MNQKEETGGVCVDRTGQEQQEFSPVSEGQGQALCHGQLRSESTDRGSGAWSARGVA